MDRQAVRKSVLAKLNAGMPKTDVFQLAVGQGAAPAMAAALIARWPDRQRMARYQSHNSLAIVALFAEAAIALLHARGAMAEMQPEAAVILTTVTAVTAFLFAAGFQRTRCAAYQVYLALSVAHLPFLAAFAVKDPKAQWLPLAVTMLMIVWVGRVHRLLFPDFDAFLRPRKGADGQYCFVT